MSRRPPEIRSSVTGGDPVELKGDGIFQDHATRYAVTSEFLEIWRRLMAGETVNYAGSHLTVEDSRLFFPPVQRPYPPLYFGGTSEAGMQVAAEHCDMYLTWGEPPMEVGQKLRAANEIAAARGRKLRFGIRLHVIVRETAAEAWAEADRLIAHVDDETIARAQATFARMDSVGQKRMLRLHGGSRDKLEISPNLWAGVGLVRGGAGTALVGDPEAVAERIREYMALGAGSRRAESIPVSAAISQAASSPRGTSQGAPRCEMALASPLMTAPGSAARAKARSPASRRTGLRC